MLISMILKELARDFEPGHQATDVPNPFALGNHSGLREHPAAQRGHGRTP